MNLDQLALQCYEECGDYHLGSVPQFNHKKFAELIVRKCLIICRINNNSSEGGEISKQIREHFGVK